MSIVVFVVGALVGGGIAVAASQPTAVAILVLFPAFAAVAVIYVTAERRERPLR